MGDSGEEQTLSEEQTLAWQRAVEAAQSGNNREARVALLEFELDTSVDDDEKESDSSGDGDDDEQEFNEVTGGWQSVTRGNFGGGLEYDENGDLMIGV